MMGDTQRVILTALTVILACGLWPTSNALLKGVTKLDELRAYYLLIEQNMWRIAQTETDQNHALQQLFEGHRVFIDENLSKIYTESDFKILNMVYEWKLLETDIITMNKLFEAFRFLLQQNHEHFDELAATDFADTVFKDEHWPVNATLDTIYNIMIQQGMYYKAMLVGDNILSIKYNQILFSPRMKMFTLDGMHKINCPFISRFRKRKPKSVVHGNLRNKYYFNYIMLFQLPN